MLESEINTNDRPGVGTLLRASRLRHGDSLRDVAASLLIRHFYLEAIEEGRYASLPGPTYAVGFVRTYAEYMGLDSDEVVRRFKLEISGVQETAELVLPTAVPERSIPGGAIAFVGVVIAVLAYGGWYASTLDERLFVELIAPLPEKLARLLPGTDAPKAPDLSTEEAAAAPPIGPVSTGDGTDVSRNDESAGSGRIEDVPAERVTIDPPLLAVRPAPAPAVVVEPIGTRALDAPAPAAREITLAEAPPIAVTAAELEAARPIPALEISRGDPAATGIDDNGVAAATDPDEGANSGGPGEDTSPAIVGAGAIRTATEDGGEVRPRQSGGVPVPPLDRDSIGGTPAGPYPAPRVVLGGPDENLLTSAGRDRFVRTDSELATLAGVIEATSARIPSEASRVARLVEDAGETATDAPGREATGREPTEDGAAEIVVRARMSSWSQVRDDAGNQLLITRLMRAGDTYRVPDRPGLRLLTGNAGALEILVGGEEAPAIGPVGAVRRDVALDPQRLLDGTATSE